jgi:hypothetical protein
MATALIRYSERPELWAESESITREVWPEYNRHGDVMNVYWSRLFEEFPGYQFVLYDTDADVVLAEGHTLPCRWDGTDEGLGDGIDALTVAAFASRDAGERPNALCAMAAEIRPQFQGRGLAARMLDAMAGLAQQAELERLIAPVRPSWKDRYPLTPIERYVRWTRGDGQPLDPWIRVHTRRGGVIARPIPQSLRITGTVAEWEAWTGMAFPDDGAYVFPAGLATVQIERGANLGSYWEPNVWIVHALAWK